MSRAAKVVERAALAGGALLAIGGALYGAELLAVRRLRDRADPDAADVLRPLDLPARVITSFDGTNLNVVATGSGTPLVLVHGVTLSMRTWVRQLQMLPARGFRVIAVDQRGHGGSSVGTAAHGVEHLGDDLMHVLEDLDLRDAILVGHSMGGIAVQSFVIRHPEIARDRVRGIVLLSTLCKTPIGSRSTRLRSAVERATRRTPDTTPLWGSPNLGLLLARVGFGRDPYPSEVELVRQMMRDCPNETRRDSTRALIGMDLAPGLAAVGLPALVVCGTADVITPPFHARQLVGALAAARLEIVEGGGHMLMLERTEYLNRLIEDFAREVGAHP